MNRNLGIALLSKDTQHNQHPPNPNSQQTELSRIREASFPSPTFPEAESREGGGDQRRRSEVCYHSTLFLVIDCVVLTDGVCVERLTPRYGNIPR